MASFDYYASPFGTRQLGHLLQSHLGSGAWTRLSAAVAWAKRSGVRHISGSLRSFSDAGGVAQIAVGIDHGGTTAEGLDMLAAAVAPRGEVWIVHHSNPVTTFHPKAFLFENDRAATALIGSGNLTEGGLFSNFELGVEVQFDFRNATEVRSLEGLRSELAKHYVSGPIAQAYSAALRQKMLERGDITTEEQAAEGLKAAIRRVVSERKPAIFGTIPIPVPPRPQAQTVSPPRRRTARGASRGALVASPTSPESIARGFVMTLQQTDAGVGQQTRGASRRSPEVFIPLAARDADPAFWGWPALFTEDATRRGKFDRTQVAMRLGAETIGVNMMTWPVKHDFRLRSELLRSAGHVGDILRIERSEPGASFDYYAEIVPVGTALHPYYAAICTVAVRNSKKRWGYYA